MNNAKKERYLFLIIIVLAVSLGILIGMYYNKSPSVSQNVSVNLVSEDKNKINLNTATEKVLASLPEVGEIKAKNIVTYRKQNGNFNNINDLLNVKGIGQSTINAIKDKVVVK